MGALRAGRGPGAVAATLALLLVGGCAAPQTRGLVQSPPPDLPAAVELERVPFHPQSRYQCGPAALATVLNVRGVDIAPAALVDEVYVPERKGSLRPEMRAAARARGLVPYPLEPELRALLAAIATGEPVLVMQNLGLSWLPRWHYAVAVGYDLDAREVVLRSGRDRRRVTDLATFERTWARADRWAQLVVRPSRPPPGADVLTWLEAVRELETTGQAAAARTGYRVATERWSASAAAWMARGNAAYAAGDAPQARRSYLRAVTLHPERPAGWNNLAYALAATGTGPAARRAARCAARLAPDDPEPRATLAEMRRLPAGGRRAPAEIPACPVDADR